MTVADRSQVTAFPQKTERYQNFCCHWNLLPPHPLFLWQQVLDEVCQLHHRLFRHPIAFFERFVTPILHRIRFGVVVLFAALFDATDISDEGDIRDESQVVIHFVVREM